MSKSTNKRAYVHVTDPDALTHFDLTVKEFSIRSGDTLPGPDTRPTHYVDEPDLAGKVSEYPLNVGAVVVVELNVDNGEFHTVRLDSSQAPAERFDMLTSAAEEILRVRDQLVKMYGYDSYEAWVKG